MWKYALTLALCLLSDVRAQGDLSAANNVTDLEGTWSSNPSVQTGRVSLLCLLTEDRRDTDEIQDFCVPAEMRFTYPNNTGISYSL